MLLEMRDQKYHLCLCPTETHGTTKKAKTRLGGPSAAAAAASRAGASACVNARTMATQEPSGFFLLWHLSVAQR